MFSPRKRMQAFSSQEFGVPESVKSLFADENPLKVLKDAHKDVILNHDMFLYNKIDISDH